MAKLLTISSNFMEFTNPGDSITGEIIKFRNITTTYGEMEVMDLANPESGEITSVGLSSNLALYRDQLYIGQIIKVTYDKNEKNSKTKRTFKKFSIEDLTDD